MSLGFIVVSRNFGGNMCRSSPRNSIPSHIGKIKNQILLILINRPPQHLRPLLQIRPCLLLRAPRKRRESRQKLKKYTPQRPIVHGVRVGFSAEDFRGHVVGGADDGVRVAGVGGSDGAVEGAAFERGAVDEGVVFDFVELGMGVCI